jgi:hypothetical protein
MHIAVSKGAKEGESSVAYAQYLADNNYVPPDAKEWVDHIRKKGNEANHEIALMSKADAEELLSFIEMLLKVNLRVPRSRSEEVFGEIPIRGLLDDCVLFAPQDFRKKLYVIQNRVYAVTLI